MAELKQNVVYGKKVVQELLRSKHPVDKIILARETDRKFSAHINSLAEKRKLPVTFVNKGEMQRFSGPVLHQGVAAILSAYNYLTEEEIAIKLKNEQKPLLLILDQIQDPHNLGAIIRSAEASGVHALILPRKGSSDITPTVAKTSAGAVFHLPIYYCDDLFSTLNFLKKYGIHLTGLSPGAGKTIYQADLNRALAVVIGSEGRGIRKKVLQYCDSSVTIPPRGKVTSLNASVAAAVMLYEVLRQRLTN